MVVGGNRCRPVCKRPGLAPNDDRRAHGFGPVMMAGDAPGLVPTTDVGRPTWDGTWDGGDWEEQPAAWLATRCYAGAWSKSSRISS
jgi:hypothetical protein